MQIEKSEQEWAADTNGLIYFTPHPSLPLQGGRVRVGVMSNLFIAFALISLKFSQ
jgi:hypothetical protein